MDASERTAWVEADRLFAELIDLDPVQRAQRLATLSITQDVRDHLLRMLANSEQGHAWLDNDGGPLAHWMAAPAGDALSMNGRRLGDWEIEGELGRGGTAVVYRVRRVVGVTGRVAALKLLTLTSLARGGAEQFHRETDILARLAHPHIVGLIDTGATDDGTPWLTMPLVDGVHIDTWCERRELGPRDVVVLFLKVAAAVAVAHRSLVIHRDLKPSNVLVDREGEVRLLDFGIARLARPDGQATRQEWRALTPDYAAPEQFTDAPTTTATDVHGLGALLHRLLTGQPPRAAVRGSEINLPSQVAAATGFAAARHLPALRADLDRVLVKALAVDPNRRYGTVDELIDDLQRWLAGHPVLALGPDRGYRLRKFVVRHRLGVAASVALVLVVAAGVSGTLWQANRARLQASQATAMKDFVLDLFASANPDLAEGQDPPASLLLRSGVRRVRNDFSDRPILLGEMLGMIGRVQLERGLLDDAESSLDGALAAFARHAVATPKWAAAVGDRGMLAYERGDPVEALRRLWEADALSAAAGLVPTDLERIYLQVRIAEMQVETQQGVLAERTAREALRQIGLAGADEAPIRPDALCVLATSLQHQDRPDMALNVLLEAEAAQRRIAPRHPKMAVILNDHGLLLHRLGRYEEAEATLQQAVERHQAIYGSSHPQTLHAMANRASLLRTWRGPVASAREYERLLPLVERALGSAPHSQRVNMLGQLALARDEAGEGSTALQAAREAWTMHQALPVEQRERTDWVAGVLGVMLFERDDAAAGTLLAGYQPPICSALETRTRFTRRVCIASALVAADVGSCFVPPATPPRVQEMPAVDRDWWLAWWLLSRQCGVRDAAEADGKIIGLSSDRTLPRWVAMRMKAAATHGGSSPGI